MQISVVIPVLNEFALLPGTLAALQRCAWVHEIIVVDGGSTDGTREWLASRGGLRVIQAPTGKGPQANQGARAAAGDVILFLHADCLVEESAGSLILEALKELGTAGGCFLVRFPPTGPRSLKWIAGGINWRTRIFRTATGDQGIFVRRSLFEAVRGFPDWPLFEDVELVRRLKTRGRFRVLSSPLTISARRFLALGPWRTVLLIYMLRLGYKLGVAPAALKRWFDDIRPDFAPGPRLQATVEDHPSSKSTRWPIASESSGRSGRDVSADFPTVPR